MYSQQQPRQKQWHHKTRSGCITCKRRRIKCDENRPSCTKCTTVGRPCEGYALPKPWLFTPAGSPTPPISTQQLDAQEQRALLFFRERTAPMLAAFTSFTERFWFQLVPQITASEAAVRHIVVALASRQELVDCSSNEVMRLSQLQGKHYAESLKALNVARTTRTSTPSVQVMLMASLMYFAYEDFQDPQRQTAGGLFHFFSGLRILKEQLAAPVPGLDLDPLLVEYLEPMFTRIELILSLFILPLAGKNAIIGQEEPKTPRLPSQFHDLLEARKTFVDICRWRYRHDALVGDWNRLSTPFRETRALLLAWHGLVMAFQDKLPAGATHERNRVTALVAQYRLLFMAMIYSGREDLWTQGDLRPASVDLSQRDAVSMAFAIPPHSLHLFTNEVPAPDPTHVRLWPLTELIRTVGDGGILLLKLVV